MWGFRRPPASYAAAMGDLRDVRERVYALSHRDLDSVELFRATIRVLRRAVPADSWCALTLDPVTLLPTGGVHDEGVPPELFPLLLDLEHATADANQFPALARSRSGVGILSRGDVVASRRYTEVLHPSGVTDELRVALRVDGRTWGGLVLFRHHGSFGPQHAALLQDVSVYLAAALRRSLVRGELEASPTPTGPGVAIFSGDRLDAMTPAARTWVDDLAEVGGSPDGLPPVLLSLMRHTRTAVRDPGLPPARARVRTRSGRWLLLHGAVLDPDGDRVAVTVEPVDPLQLAPLLMDGYDLTPREREVVELLLRGRSTKEIAGTLFVSAHTVQDHLKSIFDKTGVRSRREIVTQLLYRHYLPAIEAGHRPSTAGSFVEERRSTGATDRAR